ncbi:MAG: RnfABCDGE type electron transport complex subunit B [Methylohalobius sp.]|nr:RnfABCDGE type electron transport complex subunit B [Methylohalobius sp.]
MNLAVAFIDEGRCVGCARCLDVCPTDAIVGARNFAHTVITAQCVGCKLCLGPCPVDCIVMRPAPEALQPKTSAARKRRAQEIKRRILGKRQRLAREAEIKKARLGSQKRRYEFVQAS